MKMLINNKFEATFLTGNPTGNSRCHVLTSRALNMSCNFGQSVRSIESRCVVKLKILFVDIHKSLFLPKVTPLFRQ